jgi:hypothetical protein
VRGTRLWAAFQMATVAVRAATSTSVTVEPDGGLGTAGRSSSRTPWPPRRPRRSRSVAMRADGYLRSARTRDRLGCRPAGAWPAAAEAGLSTCGPGRAGAKACATGGADAEAGGPVTAWYRVAMSRSSPRLDMPSRAA